MTQPIENSVPSRRQMMLGSAALAGTGLAASLTSAVRADHHVANEKPRFRFCLNMSTIRGQELGAAGEIDVAGKAGYDAIEPWLRTLDDYVKQGGSLADLRKRIEDHGLTVESAIGFASWIVDDDNRRKSGLEQAKRDMDTIAQLGGKRIAAPPAGARGAVDLTKAAARYYELCELGKQMGVVPQVEMWGGNAAIGTVGAAMFVAIESGHPDACFLGDVYHTYKGGSDFDGLKLLSPQAMQVFHFNDYPANPPWESIGDADRVYPGDGIAPLKEILENFLAVGATPVLSLELFNRSYWEQDALQVARTGLEKMRAAVAMVV